jgi:hypothetical protein
MQFPTEAALKAYLAKHPKADPKKHTVKDKAQRATERQELGETLSKAWPSADKSHPISKVIAALKAGKKPNGAVLQQAVFAADQMKDGAYEGVKVDPLKAALSQIQKSVSKPEPKAKPEQTKPEAAKPEEPKSKPKAKPKAEPKPEPKAKPNEELQETALDLWEAWTYGDDDESDPVTKMITVLESGQPPAANQLNAAIEHLEKLKKQNPNSKSLVLAGKMLADLKTELGPGAKTETKPEPETKSETKSKPKSKGTTKKPELVKATFKGAGKGYGPITFKGRDEATEKKYDDVVKKTQKKWKQWKDMKTSVAQDVMAEAGVEKHTVRESYHWSRDWVDKSTDEACEDYLEQLNVPGSYARAHYEATQAVLRSKLPALQKRGIIDKDGYVTLHRGVKRGQAERLRGNLSKNKAHEVKAAVRGLSSWSESAKAATDGEFFDDNEVVLTQKIHYSRIAVSWHAENGNYDEFGEREWVVIGDESGTIEATMHSLKTIEPHRAKYEDYKKHEDVE